MFDRPSLPTLIERVRADVLSRLADDEVLRRADAEVYARVMAAVGHGLYGFADWISRQIMPDTAEDEYLVRWASIWGVQRKPAASANGVATFGTSVGASIPAGVRLRSVDGIEYETTAGATATGASAQLAIAAITPAAAGNRVAGAVLTLVSPIAGVQPTATAGTLSGGADIESIDDLRARLMMRIQQPPQGGTASDYVAWALTVPGVTRAWAYPGELGLGTVVVRFVRDGDVDPIPDAAEIAAVKEAIDQLRPVTGQVTVVAPAPMLINITVGLAPDTPAVRAAVEANLRDLLATEAVPGGTIYISRIREAVSIAAGEDHHTMTSPTSDIVAPAGKLPTLGAITYV